MNNNIFYIQMLEIFYNHDNPKLITLTDYQIILVDKRSLIDKKDKDFFRFWNLGNYNIKILTYDNNIKELYRYIIQCLLLDFERNIEDIVYNVGNFIVLYDDGSFKEYSDYHKKLEFIKKLDNFGLVYIYNFENYINIYGDKCIEFNDGKISHINTDIPNNKLISIIIFEELLNIIRSTIKPVMLQNE